MWLSEERKERVIGKATKDRSYDELADIAREVLDMLRVKGLTICETKTILDIVESALNFTPLT